MNPVILTLFGEEYAPEQLTTVGKKRKNANGNSTSKPLDFSRPKKQSSKNHVEYHELLTDWKPEKQYYSIGEVAGLFKVNTSHIRFWTKEFTIKVRTTKKGDRLYTSDQIFQLRTIYHLVKQKGFTLAGAKVKLKEEKKGVVETVNLKQSLLKLRNQLISIRNQLS